MDNDKALEVRPEQQALMPIVSVQQALEAWHTYQELCKAVLDEKDYANIKGKMAKKRSGFTKLDKFYGISVENVSEVFWQQGDDWGFDWIVKASAGGRSVTGDGSCSYKEMVSGGGIAPTRHNIRAKAYTRAFNRASANILGTGEVSAEELETEGENGQGPVMRIIKPSDDSSGDEVRVCSIHNEAMTQRVSQKTGKPYWSHPGPDGKLCFGSHSSIPQEQATTSKAASFDANTIPTGKGAMLNWIEQGRIAKGMERKDIDALVKQLFMRSAVSQCEDAELATLCGQLQHKWLNTPEPEAANA